MTAPPLPHVERTLAGFGNLPRQAARVLRPEKVADVARAFGANEPRGAVSRGLGRAYGDAALNEDGAVVLHERLGRFRSFDPDTGVLEAEGGATFASIIETFLPRGWFLPVTPGTRFVTLGGAIAADVHGKNHHRDGSIASFIDSITLLTGAGERLHCSRTEHADVFHATLGGMGLTGAILTATIRLRRVETSWMNVDYERTEDLDATLEAFGRDGAYPYSVAWIDCLASGGALGRSVLMRGDHAGLGDLPAGARERPLRVAPPPRWRMPFNLPGAALNPLTVGLFNSAYYARHTPGRRLVPYGSYFYPLDAVLDWNRMYGRRGFVQHQSVFPPGTSREALTRLLARLSKSRRPSFLAVLKSFGAAAEGPLSFPFPGHTLALDLPNTGPDLFTFLDELDDLVLEHGGRVYLAKDATLSRERFERMYPRHAEFKALLRRLDPRRRVQSSLGRRLGLVEGA